VKWSLQNDSVGGTGPARGGSILHLLSCQSTPRDLSDPAGLRRKEVGTGETHLTHHHPVEGPWPSPGLPLNGVQPVRLLNRIIRPYPPVTPVLPGPSGGQVAIQEVQTWQSQDQTNIEPHHAGHKTGHPWPAELLVPGTLVHPRTT